MENKILTYPVTDFYEAAWLWLNDIRPLNVDRQQREAVVFHFAESPQLHSLRKEWSDWKAEANLRQYISALRDIKSLAWDAD